MKHHHNQISSYKLKKYMTERTLQQYIDKRNHSKTQQKELMQQLFFKRNVMRNNMLSKK